MQIHSHSQVYTVGKLVGETAKYRLYLCLRDGDDTTQYLLQIAREAEYNGELERAAFILKELSKEAQLIEQEYAQVKTDPNAMLNYQLGFPELVESFLFVEQGMRRINLYVFPFVPLARELVPVVNLVEKDQLRVDLRTSVWMLGKLLKTLSFIHGMGITNNRIDTHSVIFHPDKHYCLLFDWSQIKIQERPVPAEESRVEVMQAARVVLDALEGNQLRQHLTELEEQERALASYLFTLAAGVVSSAKEAHERFYYLAEVLWGRSWHPFTTHPRIHKEERHG